MNSLRRIKRITACAALLIAALMALSGCVEARPTLDAGNTLPPEATPTPSPTPSPTPEPTETPAGTAAVSQFDALGNYITGADHFKQYISFRNVQVYEQEDDTFVDAIAVNDYPETLVCALTAAFYDDTKELVASGSMQTRDAQYILILEPGETVIFAQIDTDMALTALDIELIFDDSLGVRPEE